MRFYESRGDMIREEVPRGATCCEVGVFLLDFSRLILDAVAPERLFLIDRFDATMFSCDEHGGNPRQAFGHLAMRGAAALCEERSEVAVLFGESSEMIPRLPAGIGFVYIDADHTYAGCKSDLRLAWGKIAPGGILAGHDYSINEDRVVDRSHYESFGVKQAVDEFCDEQGVGIAGIALDGYTSFLIRKPT